MEAKSGVGGLPELPSLTGFCRSSGVRSVVNLATALAGVEKQKRTAHVPELL
jgi:hypothetical protein